MVGMAEEGGSYRRVVIGAAVAGSMGLALYIGVKQYERWRSQKTSATDQNGETSPEEGGEHADKGSDIPTSEDQTKKTEPSSKPGPDDAPSKPPTVVKGKSPEDKPVPSEKEAGKSKDSEKAAPDKPQSSTSDKGGPSQKEESIKKADEKPAPKPVSKPQEKPAKKEEDKPPIKPEEKAPKKEDEKPKKAAEEPPKKDDKPKPAAEREPVSSRPGEAVKTDTDIVVIEEPWHWSQPPEKTPKAEDAHEGIVKQGKATPVATSPALTYAAVAAEKAEALVKEAVASVEPSSMALSSIGDDIEIIQDTTSLGDSGDFVKFDPISNIMTQASQPKEAEGKEESEKTDPEKEPPKPKEREESKIPMPKTSASHIPVHQSQKDSEGIAKDSIVSEEKKSQEKNLADQGKDKK